MCQIYERCKCGALVWLKNHSSTSDGDKTVHEWWNNCYKCHEPVNVVSGDEQEVKK